MSKNVLLRKEQCPDCASNGGDTSKDNLAVYSDGQTHCFACGTHGFTEHSNKVEKTHTNQDKDWLTAVSYTHLTLPTTPYV